MPILLRPSGSDRWSTCTASPEMEKQIVDQESPYAAEGTAAHAELERAIKTKTPTGNDDIDMAYNYVAGDIESHDSTVLSEERVHLNRYCSGTADIVVFRKNGELEIIDLKYGRGVLVEPDSTQLAIYAMASFREFEFIAPWPIKQIITTIIQPRAQHQNGPIRSKRWEKAELDARIEIVETAIENILNNKTEFKASDKACKFCKYAGKCPMLANIAMAAVQAKFSPVGMVEVPVPDDVPGLTDDQVSAILEARSLFKTWIGAVENAAETKLQAGGKVPGFKLVRGRANRKWGQDEESIKTFLTHELKLKKSDIAPPSLISPAKAEKMIDAKARGGKAKLEKLQGVIVKPEGSITIAPESDKRPAILPALSPVVNPLS